MTIRSRRSFIASTACVTATSLCPHVSYGAVQDKVKIGQIGTKHAHASGKMSAMRGLSDLYEVVGVVEPDPVRRQAASSSKAYHGVPFVTQEQLLETKGLAAVAVETEVAELTSTALSCLQAGKHIHLDKPAGPSMKECRRIHAEANARSLTIQMGYMLRYNPAFVTLFKMVRDEWFGPITAVSAEMGKMGGEAMRKQLAQFSGGGMFELSCHVIDAVVTVMGKPEKVTAYNHRTYPERDSFADNQLAVFEYPTATATVRCNHLDPFGFPRRHFHVIGEQGYYQINPLEPPAARLALDRSRGPFKKGIQDVPMQPSSGRYDDEFRDLARVIRGEKQLAWNSQHDLAVHEAVLLGSGMPLD